MTINFSTDLLILLSKPRLTIKDRQQATSLLRKAKTWKDFYSLANRNQLLPFLYHRLSSLNLLSKTPSFFQQQLKKSFEENLAYNLLQFNEFKKLNRKFSQEKLKIVNLRGFALIKLLKVNLSTRTQADIDFLIKRRDFPKINGILLNQEYKMKRRVDIPEKLYEGKYPRQQEITFQKKVGRFTLQIDLHQEIVGSTTGRLNPLSYEKNRKLSQALIRRSKLNKLGEEKIWTLNKEDLLLSLCLHNFFHHNCRGLSRLMDLTLLAENQKLNWKLFLKKVTSYNLGSFIFYPLFWAKILLEARIPGPVLKKLKPRGFFSRFVPIFINKKTLLLPWSNITQLDKRDRENTILKFLLLDKSFFWKIKFLLRPKLLTDGWRYLFLLRKSK